MEVERQSVRAGRGYVLTAVEWQAHLKPGNYQFLKVAVAIPGGGSGMKVTAGEDYSR